MSRQRSCGFRFHGVDVWSCAPTGQRISAQGKRIRASGSRRPGFVWVVEICPNGARDISPGQANPRQRFAPPWVCVGDGDLPQRGKGIFAMSISCAHSGHVSNVIVSWGGALPLSRPRLPQAGIRCPVGANHGGTLPRPKLNSTTKSSTLSLEMELSVFAVRAFSVSLLRLAELSPAHTITLRP